MKKWLCTISFLCLSLSVVWAEEYHVSPTGNDTNDGSASSPFKTINRAAQQAQPGDVITVHEGIYREKVVPPRGGTSDRMRITYQAAPGERVVITGSEPVKGWVRVQNDTWKLVLPNTFFGETNPYDEQIYGSWYRGKGKPNHTGSVYLNGKRIRETFSLHEVLQPVGGQPYWYAEADGNGGPVLMNLEWIHPCGGKRKNSMQASVEGGDQAVCIAIVDRWPFGYLKDGSVLHFDEVDFGNGTDTLLFQAATLAKGGIVEMHLDSPQGELLGMSMVTNTGDWEQFAVFPLVLSRKLSGMQNVCLVIRAPALKKNGKTTIWAQFPGGIDPNESSVEIAVRPQVFYPDETGIDYLTVRGFILENAATNWAPPSAEQPGLIGPRWAKGWIIENNVIRNSRCSGISLGRPTFGHAHHYQGLPPEVYPETRGGQTREQLMDYFEHASWDKEEAGFHIVRNNHIYECGQAGIVGCSGGAFCLIQGNEIHDICIGETFEGDEMAGIKLHFSVDAVLKDNHLYRTIRGLWLDCGAQGVQVVGNLFHDNGVLEDIFIEVCHGPTLVANNILLSEHSNNYSQGIASVHNLVAGDIVGGVDRCAGGRLSFYYPPHETVSTGKAPNPGGDQRWYNNLLVNRASLGKWDEPGLPIVYGKNLFAAGAHPASDDACALVDTVFDPDVQLEQRDDGWYLSMNISPDWGGKKEKWEVVTTDLLGKAVAPDLPFVHPDGSRLKLLTDYFGNKRRASNPYPGPIEVKKAGRQQWKVWPK